MKISLIPIDETNREAVIALSVCEDQPFVAPNEYSLEQADETNAKHPGVARPFAVYADSRLVGFCMFAFAPEAEDEDDRYWLWRFMIDKSEQGKGYGQAALTEIIKYFRDNGADRLHLSTEPENEAGMHIYHKFGFRETGEIDGGEAEMMQFLNFEMQPCEEDDAEFFREKIDEISDSIVPPAEGANDEYVFLKITDDDDNILGGCIMEIDSWNIAELDILWVDEKYRRQGLGSALIREAERVAREKGCYAMTLGTFDFQARPLYEKHGYKVVGTIKDWPRGHENYSLMKRLDQPSPEYVPSNAVAYEIKPASGEEADIIDDGLGDYNHSQAPYEHEFIWLNKKVLDEDGNLIAGIIAGVQGWNSAHIKMMWVDEEQRNRGIGTYLLSDFEREAKEKGAYKVILDALDWQMPFFEKHGYTICGTLEDCPKGHRWCQMQKLL
ncbi:MAG: GNAT family N-acetyltransferase [Mogibacterium sp.]|nr:GNAT family N-acetyltransferase [Mogibacterium sp.]MBQ6499787.1 GNAT family N-acetyltransferase [Mogibacterium sp.]